MKGIKLIINNKQKTQQIYISLLDSGNLITSEKELANTFNRYVLNVADKLIKILENNFLRTFQEGKSTELAINALLNKVTESLDSKMETYSQGFDILNHNILLKAGPLALHAPLLNGLKVI